MKKPSVKVIASSFGISILLVIVYVIVLFLEVPVPYFIEDIIAYPATLIFAKGYGDGIMMAILTILLFVLIIALFLMALYYLWNLWTSDSP